MIDQQPLHSQNPGMRFPTRKEIDLYPSICVGNSPDEIPGKLIWLFRGSAKPEAEGT